MSICSNFNDMELDQNFFRFGQHQKKIKTTSNLDSCGCPFKIFLFIIMIVIIVRVKVIRNKHFYFTCAFCVFVVYVVCSFFAFGYLVGLW